MKNRNNILHVTIKSAILITIVASILICSLFYFINSKQKQDLYNEYNLKIEDKLAVYEIQKDFNEYVIIAILIVIAVSASYVLISYIIFKKQKKDLKVILKNLENIHNNNYNFLIDEVNKGTFQSDLYKICIQLQEYSKEIEKDRNKLNSYLSDISHQIRTPIFSLMVLVDNLQENKDLSKESEKEYINKISLELDKISWLVDNLLKMAQLDTKIVTMNTDKVYIKDIVKQAIKNVEILAELKEEKIVVDGDLSASFIGDFKWTVEAITNILKNAIEHSNVNQKIYVTYSENVLYTEINIKDCGSGMEENEVLHIFDRFYKGKNSGKDSFGIGLSIAKEIIELQNGEINVKSKINKGTEFNIKFMK